MGTGEGMERMIYYVVQVVGGEPRNRLDKE